MRMQESSRGAKTHHFIRKTMCPGALLPVALFLLFFSGCLDLSEDPKPEGILTGKVTLGPLCPVEPCQLTPEEIQAAYEARKILIYDKDTTVILWKAGINADSTYLLKLTQGKYIVDFEGSGADYSDDVPAQVTITPYDTTRLDIDIDTGIR